MKRTLRQRLAYLRLEWCDGLAAPASAGVLFDRLAAEFAEPEWDERIRDAARSMPRLEADNG